MIRTYITKRDRLALRNATKFEELTIVAFSILGRMPQPIGQVCGPITSGGLGSAAKNTRVLRKAIEKLGFEGFNIFNQLPFEVHMSRIIRSPYYKNEGQLLRKFYLPLFKSGLIQTLYFVPGWESSYGASWEHAWAERLNLKIVYL